MDLEYTENIPAVYYILYTVSYSAAVLAYGVCCPKQQIKPQFSKCTIKGMFRPLFFHAEKQREIRILNSPPLSRRF